MGRPPKIRITENDRKEYARLAKNTKAKAQRTFKTVGRYITDAERDENGNINIVQKDIMEMFQVPALEEFETRKEFNEWKEKQSKINSGKNPHYNFKKNDFGIAATEFFLTAGENREYKSELLARKELEKREGKPIVYKGEVVGTQVDRDWMMARPSAVGFSKVKFNFKNAKSFRDLEKNFEKLDERSNPEHFDKRKETMRDNWLKSLQGSFNSLADDIYDAMYSMNPDDWYELYRYKLIDMDFELYDSEGQFVTATSENLDEIREIIDDYYNGRFNLDMKGF